METLVMHPPYNDTKATNTNSNQFIEANTREVSLSHLQHDCIIPVFSKDNETTISHQEFIESFYEVVTDIFPMEQISIPDIRVSHEIKGRIPEAIGKPVKELLAHEKTVYYERMAFIIEISSIRNVINGNELKLTVGGVRAYNQENLYSKKAMEKFKVFIGFKNMVCCNLCISTDGYLEELRASNSDQLKQSVELLLQQYNMENHLACMDQYAEYELSQKQFCQFIGRSRLYQYLPKNIKNSIPYLAMNDGQIGAIAKAYYEDENFASDENGCINLWKMYNLFTGATKSSYIDNYLERTTYATVLTNGLISALNGQEAYKWFIS